MDDPFSLLAFAVWTLAAGMYPLGFMFGVCSACCDECPDECSKCTHFFNFGGLVQLCPAAMDVLPGTVEATVGDCGVLTQLDEQLVIWNDFFNTGCVESPFGFTDVEIVEFTQCGNNVTECGCGVCSFRVGMRARLGCIYLLGESCAFLDECEQTSLTFSEFGSWGFFQLIDCPDPDNNLPTEEDIAAAVAWANDNIPVTITSSAYFEPCECGACCDDAACEDNVAEGGCDNWAGVGTACDDNPDPCEE